MLLSDKCHKIAQEYEQLRADLTGLIEDLLESFGTPVMKKGDKEWPRCLYVFPDLVAADIFVEAYWTGEDVPVATAVMVDGVFISPHLVAYEVWTDFFRDEPGQDFHDADTKPDKIS